MTEASLETVLSAVDALRIVGTDLQALRSYIDCFNHQKLAENREQRRKQEEKLKLLEEQERNPPRLV
jgi:hypothetical protein